MAKNNPIKITYLTAIELAKAIPAVKLDEQTKLAYAGTRVYDQLPKIIDKYNKKVSDVNIDHCETDEKGRIIYDEKGNYLFNKENMKARMEKLDAIEQEEVEIEPYFCTDLDAVKKLPLTVIRKLDGIVFQLPEDFYKSLES